MIARILAALRRTPRNDLADAIRTLDPITVDDEALERYRRYHSSNQFGR